MCYGDIDHGTDGYYRRWIEVQEPERDELEASYTDDTTHDDNEIPF